MYYRSLYEFLELKSIQKRISSTHSNGPHSAHGPLANTGPAGLLGAAQCVRSRRVHRACGCSRVAWWRGRRGFTSGLGVPFLGVGERVAYGEGAG
jgi:hypothetical protein